MTLRTLITKLMMSADMNLDKEIEITILDRDEECCVRRKKSVPVYTVNSHGNLTVHLYDIEKAPWDE